MASRVLLVVATLSLVVACTAADPWFSLSNKAGRDLVHQALEHRAAANSASSRKQLAAAFAKSVTSDAKKATAKIAVDPKKGRSVDEGMIAGRHVVTVNNEAQDVPALMQFREQRPTPIVDERQQIPAAVEKAHAKKSSSPADWFADLAKEVSKKMNKIVKEDKTPQKAVFVEGRKVFTSTDEGRDVPAQRKFQSLKAPQEKKQKAANLPRFASQRSQVGSGVQYDKWYQVIENNQKASNKIAADVSSNEQGVENSQSQIMEDLVKAVSKKAKKLVHKKMKPKVHVVEGRKVMTSTVEDQDVPARNMRFRQKTVSSVSQMNRNWYSGISSHLGKAINDKLEETMKEYSTTVVKKHKKAPLPRFKGKRSAKKEQIRQKQRKELLGIKEQLAELKLTMDRLDEFRKSHM